MYGRSAKYQNYIFLLKFVNVLLSRPIVHLRHLFDLLMWYMILANEPSTWITSSIVDYVTSKGFVRASSFYLGHTACLIMSWSRNAIITKIVIHFASLTAVGRYVWISSQEAFYTYFTFFASKTSLTVIASFGQSNALSSWIITNNGRIKCVKCIKWKFKD